MASMPIFAIVVVTLRFSRRKQAANKESLIRALADRDRRWIAWNC
jgi:hypothetical protein